MGRSPCCEKVGLKKGPWTPEEDQKLMAYIEEHGHGSWRALPAKAGLQRCGKSCRLRWTNYLRPDIKRGKFSLQEEQTIIQLHALLGNRWSAIAAQLPRRTDNEIKNYWNTHLKKRLTRMGIDPTTHKPKADTLGGIDVSHSKDSANLSHMAQWESARLEAEARLVRESKLQVQNQLGSSPSSTQPARLVLNKITAQASLPPCLDVLKAWKNSWSSTATTNKDPNNSSNRMHSMYAMMLSTDETLESPTSTLCFPGSNMLPMASSTNTTTVGSSVLDELNKSSSGSATWGYLTKQINPDEEEEEAGGLIGGDERSKREHNSNNALRDDDIMVAVEAFRSSSSSSPCAGAYGDNNNSNNNSNVNGVVSVPPQMASSSSDVVGMGGLSMSDHEGMVYDTSCNDDLGIMEEGNKHYWNTILNFVNDAHDMF